MANGSTKDNEQDPIARAKDRLRQGERLWLPEAIDPEWSKYGELPDPEKVCTEPEISGVIVERTMVVTDFDDSTTGAKKLAPAVVIHLDEEHRVKDFSDYIQRTGYGKIDGDLFGLARVGDWIGLSYTGIKTPRDPNKKPYSGFRVAHVPRTQPDPVADELERDRERANDEPDRHSEH